MDRDGVFPPRLYPTPNVREASQAELDRYGDEAGQAHAASDHWRREDQGAEDNRDKHFEESKHGSPLVSQMRRPMKGFRAGSCWAARFGKSQSW